MKSKGRWDIKAIFICIILLASTIPLEADTKRWLEWEISRNDFESNTEAFRALPDEAQRSRLGGVHELIEAWIPLSRLNIRGQAGSLVRTTEKGEKVVRFLIHPFAQHQFKKILEGVQTKMIPALPTASFRVFEVDGQHVKVPLPETINGIDRTVWAYQIERATAISKILSQMPQDENIKHHFNFLPEVTGVFPVDSELPFGMLVREIPDRIREGNHTLVPLFAFLSRPKDGSASLFEQQVSRSLMGPEKYVETKLIPAIQEAFFYPYATQGILFEAHQQNTLLEIDRNGNFTGQVYFRDLDGCRINPIKRQQLGLSNHMINEMPLKDLVFDLPKVKGLAVKKTLVGWDGLLDHGYSLYVENSIFYQLERALKTYY